MKVFAIVLILMGILVFYIGLKGSQHEVMAMLKGQGSNVVASGKSINASGGSTNLTNTGGATTGTTGVTQQQANQVAL